MSRKGESMETEVDWLEVASDWVEEGTGWKEVVREGTGTVFLFGVMVMVMEMFCNWIVVTVSQLSEYPGTTEFYTLLWTISLWNFTLKELFQFFK